MKNKIYNISLLSLLIITIALIPKIQSAQKFSDKCIQGLLANIKSEDIEAQLEYYKECSMRYDKNEQIESAEEQLEQAHGLFLYQGGKEEEWKNLKKAIPKSVEEKCAQDLYALTAQTNNDISKDTWYSLRYLSGGLLPNATYTYPSQEELDKIYAKVTDYDTEKQQKIIDIINKAAGIALAHGDLEMHSFLLWQTKNWLGEKSLYYINNAVLSFFALQLLSGGAIDVRNTVEFIKMKFE